MRNHLRNDCCLLTVVDDDSLFGDLTISLSEFTLHLSHLGSALTGENFSVESEIAPFNAHVWRSLSNANEEKPRSIPVLRVAITPLRSQQHDAI